MFNEKKRLSLDDFKAQANKANTSSMMDSIKGGVTDNCHVHGSTCPDGTCKPGTGEGKLEP